jgi:hypothetical protein
MGAGPAARPWAPRRRRSRLEVRHHFADSAPDTERPAASIAGCTRPPPHPSSLGHLSCTAASWPTVLPRAASLGPKARPICMPRRQHLTGRSSNPLSARSQTSRRHLPLTIPPQTGRPRPVKGRVLAAAPRPMLATSLLRVSSKGLPFCTLSRALVCNMTFRQSISGVVGAHQRRPSCRLAAGREHATRGSPASDKPDSGKRAAASPF